MSKILLIQPPYERLMGYSRYYVHPGLLSLAVYIEKSGFDVLIYDADYSIDNTSHNATERLKSYDMYIKALTDEDNVIWKEIKNVIEGYNPEYIGITTLSSTLESSKIIANIAKKINNNIIIISGGVQATLLPNTCLEFSDYVITKEGEVAIVNVMKGMHKKGIIEGELVTELDKLPYPLPKNLHNVNDYNRRDLSLVMSSRGCYGKCEFCNSHLLWGSSVRRKSVKYFVEEIRRLKEDFFVQDFFISDDCFSFNKKWLYDFCNQVKELNVSWRCMSRVDTLTINMVRMMKEAGCRNIKLGIESGSQRILDKMNKNINLDQIHKINSWLHKEIEWSAFFILGYEGENIEDIRMTQDLIKELNASSITVSVYTPYPGSKYVDTSNIDYSYYSQHSPHNNFTNCIEDDVFKELLYETIELSKGIYNEH